MLRQSLQLPLHRSTFIYIEAFSGLLFCTLCHRSARKVRLHLVCNVQALRVGAQTPVRLVIDKVTLSYRQEQHFDAL